jgi:hypothetical protein
LRVSSKNLKGKDAPHRTLGIILAENWPIGWFFVSRIKVPLQGFKSG